jgi:hypothetical protein
MSLKITLTDVELQEAKNLASIRSSQKAHLDEQEVRTSANPPSFERHFLGLRGEIAVAKVLKTLIDKRFNWGDGNSGDVYTSKGESIQVKTKSRKTSDRVFRLRSESPEEFSCEYGILCVEHSDKVIELYGWFDYTTFQENYILESTLWGNKVGLEPQHFNLFARSPFPVSSLHITREQSQYVFDPILSLLETIQKNSNKQTLSRESVLTLLSFMREAVERAELRYGGFEKPLL